MCITWLIVRIIFFIQIVSLRFCGFFSGRTSEIADRSHQSDITHGQEVNLSPETLKNTSSRKKVQRQAADLFARHFEHAQSTARSAARGTQGLLHPVVARISQAIQKQTQQQDIKHVLREEKSWSDDFRAALRDLVVAIRTTGDSISPYEVQSAGLVKILNAVFDGTTGGAGAMGKDALRVQRVDIWKSVFHQAELAARPGKITGGIVDSPLVAVLECGEKFPVAVPDNAAVGPGGGFQVLIGGEDRAEVVFY